MSTATATTTPRRRRTTKQKVGLVLAILSSLASIPSVLGPSGEPGQDGPPFAILVLSTLLGFVGVVTGVMAWRGNDLALRVCAGALIVSALTGVPAFFVDVPMVIKVVVGVGLVLTVVTVILMFSGDRLPDDQRG